MTWIRTGGVYKPIETREATRRQFEKMLEFAPDRPCQIVVVGKERERQDWRDLEVLYDGPLSFDPTSPHFRDRLLPSRAERAAIGLAHGVRFVKAVTRTRPMEL